MPRSVERECPVCLCTYDVDPLRLRRGLRTTCSRACSYRLRGLKKEQRSVLSCPVCGNKFVRSPAQIKAKHGTHYCSRACHYAGRTLGLTARVVTTPYVRTAGPRSAETTARQVATRRARGGYIQSDDTRARLREATARRIAEGRIPAVSRLEDVVAEHLAALGVVSKRQVPIRGAHGRFVAVVDFLLADGRALEVNGTFWHADPRAYPNGPVFPAQRRTASAWERKVIALRDLGTPLLIVWEADIEQHATEAVRVALA